MHIFRCKHCEKPAEWLVWYKDCGNLYNYCCMEHTIAEMKQETEETRHYPVINVRHIDDVIYKYHKEKNVIK